LAQANSPSEYQSWQNDLTLAQSMGLEGLFVTVNNQLAVKNTSAYVVAYATALNKLIASNVIASMAFTDTAPSLSVTPAQLTTLAPVLGVVTTQFSLVESADPNTNETLVRPSKAQIPNLVNDTISFAAEPQAVTINLATDTASTTASNVPTGP